MNNPILVFTDKPLAQRLAYALQSTPQTLGTGANIYDQKPFAETFLAILEEKVQFLGETTNIAKVVNHAIDLTPPSQARVFFSSLVDQPRSPKRDIAILRYTTSQKTAVPKHPVLSDRLTQIGANVARNPEILQSIIYTFIHTEFDKTNWPFWDDYLRKYIHVYSERLYDLHGKPRSTKSGKETASSYFWWLEKQRINVLKALNGIAEEASGSV